MHFNYLVYIPEKNKVDKPTVYCKDKDLETANIKGQGYKPILPNTITIAMLVSNDKYYMAHIVWKDVLKIDYILIIDRHFKLSRNKYVLAKTTHLNKFSDTNHSISILKSL